MNLYIHTPRYIFSSFEAFELFEIDFMKHCRFFQNRIVSLDFNSTSAWTAWRTASMTANLAAGNNLIRATTVGHGGPHMDNLTIR